MLKKWLLFTVFLYCAFSLYATHNRSGDITYKYLYGNTYEFTITTCTKLSSEANRDKLEIHYGDGQTDTLPRTLFYDFSATDTKQNYYTGIHTFTGPGSYLINVEDPNRNSNILNINNSVDKIFCVQTLLIISPFLGKPNNSLQISDCPCPEIACSGKPWVYNMGVYDPDGDSLAYSIIPCKGEGCLDMPIPGEYQYPDIVGGGVLSIDPVFGTINWVSPMIVGEYNLAILIREFRAGFQIGYVIRDMQVTVNGLCLNNAPEIQLINDTCVFANDTIVQNLFASDTPATPADNPILTWSVFGEAYTFSPNPATFVPFATGNPISGVFSWTPSCTTVRNTPYNFIFEAEDQGPNVALKDIFAWRIKVNLPAVQNLNLTVNPGNFALNWDIASCPNVIGYRVYRKADSVFVNDDCCANGLAEGLGFQKIASISGKTNTVFVDSDVVVGNKYCYLVTAVASNGTESCLPAEVCDQLKFELPVLTRVSINNTDILLGSDTVAWSRPKELDTNIYSGPYQYLLYERYNDNSAFNNVYSGAVFTSFSQGDSIYLRNNINTINDQWEYRLELLNNSQVLGSSPPAKSIYLNFQENDNQVNLTWQVDLPWNNTLYEIYRKSISSGGIYILIGTSNDNNYDDLNLINGIEYCYKIKSIGSYSLPNIEQPLINWSQEICAMPTDKTAPCAPLGFNLLQDCSKAEIKLSWRNPNNSCADDVTKYYVYFGENKDSPFEKIAVNFNASDTTFTFKDSSALVGCFYVTAIDSAIYGNESLSSDTICVENCVPVFNLPNVVTPNGDGNNDVFHVIFPIKYIDSLNFSVVNRWGQEVFQTNDLNINWDGRENDKNKPVVNGVYFYICRLYIKTLNGVEEKVLQGNITVIY